jgi:carbon starvation protein
MEPFSPKPTGVAKRIFAMIHLLRTAGWVGVALLGAWAYAVVALRRGEPINSAYLLVAALCSYAVGYRFYSKWIAVRVLGLNDRRATPCEVHDDGKDFVKTNRWIVFGHHFAAISGPGPLVGPVLAAQFGYLPGTLWILIGVVLGGAVQDFVILFSSIRRDGKSLGQMVKEELNSTAGVVGLLGILAIMTILLAVLALVVVNALADSPWGVFTVGATIPIALCMGGYLRLVRVGKVLEVSALGVGLLLLAVWGGQFVHSHANWSAAFSLDKEKLAWAIILYGLAASILPVWLLLAPRDYLSTFMKLGTIFALAVGVLLVLPDLKMPALSKFIDGTGLVIPGRVFPFCFITIACGAISGFHALIASGITPKIITRESYARSIGYGAMCLESLVAMMAMIAACTLEPSVYLGMNVAGASADPVARAAEIAAKIQTTGFTVSLDEMSLLAEQVGERSLFGRTGGAATLAVGMAQIFARLTDGRWVDLWYHFAIMFEALFILTTLDAGTRVGRYLLQDMLGQAWRPLADTRSVRANLVASLLMVSGWGFFLIQGVRDPDGGVKALWPLFGIANQLLASIALCLATTILLKMHLRPAAADPVAARPESALARRPAVIWVTLVPLVWLLSVTLTAGVQKIFHPQPAIGFLARAALLEQQRPALAQALAEAEAAQDEDRIRVATRALRLNRQERFNQRIDAVAAGTFLALVVMMVLMSVREWVLLLGGRKQAILREAPAVWLPETALAPARSWHLLGLIPLAFALLKELSGEAALDRARRAEEVAVCAGDDPGGHASSVEAAARGPRLEVAEARRREQARYLHLAERRYRGINRCC